jgi:hypothetical protein
MGRRTTAGRPAVYPSLTTTGLGLGRAQSGVRQTRQLPATGTPLAPIETQENQPGANLARRVLPECWAQVQHMNGVGVSMTAGFRAIQRNVSEPEG